MKKDIPDRKPRLLVIHNRIAVYRVDIFNAMSRISEFTLALLYRNKPNHHFDEELLVSKLDVSPIYIDKKFRVFNRDFPFDVVKLIGKLNPDIVVTGEFSATTFVVAIYKLFRRGRFHHIIWTDDNVQFVKNDSRLRRLARWLIKSRVDGWMFISDEIRIHYESTIGINSPSAVVPVIHDEVNYRQLLDQSGALYQKLVVEHNLLGKRVLLYVGRLVEVKGIDLIIRASVKVIHQLENTMLIIVGDGEELNSLTALAESLRVDPFVRFVGRQVGVELAAWYRVGQVFVLASQIEAFGAVVNEALIAGLPVVISNNAGARSLIEEGVNGSVVLPNETDRFAEVLIEWLERVEPVEISKGLRPNLMTTKFEDVVNSVTNLLNKLMAK